MGFLNKFSSLIPLGKKEEVLEYFFALNIEAENLTAALWAIEKKELKILDTASFKYKDTEEIVGVADKLLDAVLGVRVIDVQKILFGVPDSWLHEDNLKEEYLKLLRKFVKEFELSPMAYVASSHALVHYLEKKEEVPTTAILVGIEEGYITTTVVRAGKLDGSKTIQRGDDVGIDIEKALLNFTTVETLPSKILLYGKDLEKLEKEKGKLLSFPWMSKLSFLHLPKIDILEEGVEILSVCMAGGSELVGDISYKGGHSKKQAEKTTILEKDEVNLEKEILPESKESSDLDKEEKKEQAVKEDTQKDFGFTVGDISEQVDPDLIGVDKERDKISLGESGEVENEIEDKELLEESNVVVPQNTSLINEVEKKFKFPIPSFRPSIGKFFPSGIKRFLPKRSKKSILVVLAILLILGGALSTYLFLPKSFVKVFVEPRILEKDTQVTADPKQKEIDEINKIIPAQIIETEVTGSDKEEATGTKRVGDAAKGIVIIYNKTDDSKTFSKGTEITGSSGTKFTLDTSVSIASQSATRGGVTYGNVKVGVTAVTIGAEGNIPSGSELSIGGNSKSQFSVESEGNFSGGTSKEVTVVSSDDQKRLLAKLSSSLRQSAQQKLQEKLLDKKIIQEALVEEITKKSFSKNINDQASEFSLNLTARYKGTAFDEKDLKAFVSKLVTTDVPVGFELKLEDTETQSDISKLEKDGKLIFLARFRAKLMPKIDTNKIKSKIKGKTPRDAIETLKKIENILDAEITFSPKLPPILQRIPLLDKNIHVEVGLK